jgi:hypothetical protein
MAREPVRTLHPRGLPEVTPAADATRRVAISTATKLLGMLLELSLDLPDCIYHVFLNEYQSKDGLKKQLRNQCGYR